MLVLVFLKSSFHKKGIRRILGERQLSVKKRQLYSHVYRNWLDALKDITNKHINQKILEKHGGQELRLKKYGASAFINYNCLK